MNYPLSVTNVHAGYNNRHNIAEMMKGASLHLHVGSINGLLGRNGSGKTTLIRAAHQNTLGMALTLPPSRNYRSHYSRQGKELPQSYYFDILCITLKAKKRLVHFLRRTSSGLNVVLIGPDKFFKQPMTIELEQSIQMSVGNASDFV